VAFDVGLSPDVLDDEAAALDQRGQLQPHRRVRARDGRPDPVVDPIVQRVRGRTGWRHRGIRLLEDRDTARPQDIHDTTQQEGRIGQVHQHAAGNGGVMGCCAWQGVREVLLDEGDVGQNRLLGQRNSPRDGACVPVHADDVAGLSHQLRDQSGDHAGTAAQVDDPHPRADARVYHQPSGEGASLPLLDATCDVVLAFDSMDHWAEVPASLAEARREGGRLVVVKDSDVSDGGTIVRIPAQLTAAGFRDCVVETVSEADVTFTMCTATA
jgi:hypothetical protein